MNWDHIEDNWKQFSGAIKEKWDKPTEQEIAELKGNARPARSQDPAGLRPCQGPGKERRR